MELVNKDLNNFDRAQKTKDLTNILDYKYITPFEQPALHLYSALCGKGTVRQWLRSLSPINQNGRLA